MSVLTDRPSREGLQPMSIHTRRDAPIRQGLGEGKAPPAGHGAHDVVSSPCGGSSVTREIRAQWSGLPVGTMTATGGAILRVCWAFKPAGTDGQRPLVDRYVSDR